MTYTAEQKQEVLEYFNIHGYSETAKKYRATIYPETIRRWTKPELQIYYKNKHRENYLTRRKKHKTLQAPDHIFYEPADYVVQKEPGVLQRAKSSYHSASYINNIVLKYQKHFFNKQYSLWNDLTIRGKLIENREKYLGKPAHKITPKEFIRGFGVAGICRTYSHFSPLWFSKFIEDHNASVVYDPCGGWGHRLLGAYKKDITYIYNDLWQASYLGAQSIAKFLTYHKCSFYNNDASKFTPSDHYDAIFTCPPYFNVETYQNKKFKDLSDYQSWWGRVIRCALKPSVKTVGIVINRDYKDIIKIECVQSGLLFDKEISIGPAKLHSHFCRKNQTDLDNTREVLLVFTYPVTV